MNEKAGVRKTTNSNQSDSELAECKREWKMFITTFLDTTVTSQSRERLGRERRGKKMMGGERTRTRRPKQLRGREKKYDQYGWKGLVNPTVGESSDKKKKRKKKSEIRTKDKIGECVGKFSNKTSYGIIGFAVVHQGREKGISGITWQWWWVGSVWGLMWRREEKADHQSMDEVLWRQDWLRRTKMKWVRWVVGFFFYLESMMRGDWRMTPITEYVGLFWPPTGDMKVIRHLIKKFGNGDWDGGFGLVDVRIVDVVGAKWVKMFWEYEVKAS